MDLFAYIHSDEENRRAEEAQRRHKTTTESIRRDVESIANRRTYQAMLDSVADWQLPELPQLDAFDEVIIDLETTGLRWWDDDRMIGAGIWTPDGVRRYLPVRHKIGPNHDWATFVRWVQRELRGKRIVNIRTKFDLHMFRMDGLDLEAQGCTFGDVAHYAGLLDDHRRLFNQEALVHAFLGEELAGKVRRAYGFDLDPSKFAEYPAGLVAPRAEDDVLQVSLLQKAMWPQLAEQDLHKVRGVEDRVIPVVVEMEHNGALLDVDMLDRWVRESERDLNHLRHAIKRGTGIEVEKFTKRDTALRLFRVLHIEPPVDPDEPTKEGGEPNYSIADALLKPIRNRWIQAYRAGLQLQSLRSKFLLKYQRSVARDGILRYELHQMPYQDDDEGSGGAVSGRFSSAAPSRQEGANIQQVFGVDSQKKGRPFTRKYIVKKLFIPDRRSNPEAMYVNADASQLQFRIFGHYGNSERIIQAYQRDWDWEAIDALKEKLLATGVREKDLPKEAKLNDFHEVVSQLIIEFAQVVLTRTHTKNVNFAQVFGAGVPKMASQLGVPANQIPTREQWAEAVRFRKTDRVGGPEFRKVVELSNTYHRMFPEVKPLLGMASHLAMPGHRNDDRSCGLACQALYEQGYEHRGWVRTFDGRRARFGPHDRHYSALNRVIQGTEADVIKRILCAVHEERHSLGFLPRFTVHDAVAGDLQDPGRLKDFKRLLNHQYLDFRVPILWEIGMGNNWAEAK